MTHRSQQVSTTTSASSPRRGGNGDAPPVDDRAPERMDPEHRVAAAVGREQIRHGEIASAEEVEATLRLFDP